MKRSIIEVVGIGWATSVLLEKNGFKTVLSLANASVESLSKVPGFANFRANQVIMNAKYLLKDSAIDGLGDDEISQKIKAKKLKKNKKNKKNKKKVSKEPKLKSKKDNKARKKQKEAAA